MRSRSPLFLIFFFTPQYLFSQDISGYWQGVTYQYVGGPTPYYPTSSVLAQNGNVITGTFLYLLPNSPAYDVNGLSGNFTNNLFTYQETGIIRQITPPLPYYWCYNDYGSLTFNNSTETLIGPTNSPGCGGEGRIELWRLKVISDTVFCHGNPARITVTGQNIRWYSDSSLTTLVYSGNTIAPRLDSTILFFVTQTHYNTESPALPIRIVIKPPSFTTISQTICKGESFLGYTESGTYIDTLTASNGCDSIRTLRLVVHSLPHPKFVADSVLCLGSSLVLNPGIFDSYLWQDGSTSPTYTVSQPGVYSVSVVNSCGKAQSTINVMGTDCKINFPSAFTPNHDGNNDVFSVLNGHTISAYHLVIYNRWGIKVFETADYTKGWDGELNGRLQQSGIYIWTCVFETRNNPFPELRKGSVLLIR